MQRQELEGLSREQLITLAERLGIPRPRVLTQPELVDEIIGHTAKDEREKAKARGWLGRARDLLTRVVERGLHLPEAARVFRSSSEERAWPSPPPPLATVTLAEIYAAQGHLDRAIDVLNAVLSRDPEHQEALSLRARFTEQSRARTRGSRGAPGDAAAPAAKPAIGAAPEPATPEPGAEAAKPPGSLDKHQEKAKAETRAGPSESTERHDARGASTRGTTAAPAHEATAETREEPARDHGSRAAAVASTAEAATGAPDAGPRAEEASVFEDAKLPDRYDVDEIVAIAVDPLTLYLYWEVRARTLARAQARRPDGWLGMRIVSVIASWSGPVVRIQDLRIDALYGDRFVRGVEPGSNVRVSVGWKSGGDFEPFAVGVEVTVPHLNPMTSVAEHVAVWEPQQSGPAEPRRAIARSAIGDARAPHFPPHTAPWLTAARAPAVLSSKNAPSEAPVDHGIAVLTGEGPVLAESVSTPAESRPWFIESAPSFTESVSESFTTFLDSFTTFTDSFTTVTESFTTLTWDVTEQTEVAEVFDAFEWGESTVSYIGPWIYPVGASELGRGASASQLIRRGASQLIRRGASQLIRRGASQLIRRGASQLIRRGASELSRWGASELSRWSASDLSRWGASDLSRRGGSELSRGGGSALSRKLR